MVLTLTEVQRLLLGIIASVESGVTTPEEAVRELNDLKVKAVVSGLRFKAAYTLEDFQKIRQNYISTYESSEAYIEPSYEESVETSY